MAALVQTYPQQSNTVTMLQTRPSSASGIIQPNAQGGQMHQQYISPQVHRNSYHSGAAMAPTSYRGQTTTQPMSPYGYSNAPIFAGASPRMQAGTPHLRTEQRTSSAPVIPMFQQFDANLANNRSRYPSAPSTTSSSSSEAAAPGVHGVTRDDSALLQPTRNVSRTPRPHSTIITSVSTAGFTPPILTSPAKASPDRYRRANRSNSSSSTSSPGGMAAVNQQYSQNYPISTIPAFNAPKDDFTLQMPQKVEASSTGRNAADDTSTPQKSGSEQAKRYRRRSINTAGMGARTDSQSNSQSKTPSPSQQGSPDQIPQLADNVPQSLSQDIQQHPLRSSPIVAVPPTSFHSRHGSTDSAASARSGNSRSVPGPKREPSVSMATASPSPIPNQNPALNAPAAEQSPPTPDQPKTVSTPVRGSSSDGGAATKRIVNPSPLSKPMTMSTETPTSKDSFASAVNAALQTPPKKPDYAQAANGNGNGNGAGGSAAMQALGAFSNKDEKKGKTSRLRRAFSFGSAAELRKASAQNSAINHNFANNERSRLQKDQFATEQDAQEAEHARIAQKQEAGGLGEGIYNGQGQFFSGSTDNLSISSTASSASVMIRKMGKGMKKSTRSLVGLFRPKSVIGVPAADAAVPQSSQAQVSMVTVEAEREKVNVNADPHVQAGGGTGFPKLERNSVDTAAAASEGRIRSSSTDGPRRSIVGGEKERAEVLAAVKKGILKRSGTDSGSSSPVIRPTDSKASAYVLPMIPNMSESPNSSAPSTPGEDAQSNARKGSVTIPTGEDYFMSALRFRGDSKSVPGTPNTMKRNATFSPRIQFHDTWPSGEYDRRGEIATCNRLTPMLAQQIKEELNTFKMEMEVHENSKIYTHFF